jgi:hypothetical protein
MTHSETVAQMVVVDQCPDGSETLPNAKPEAVAKLLMELQPAKADDGNTLLGNRFLCRGAGLELVGPSGIGKSTAIVQMGICWAVGRECFGIPPKQSPKILYVQAENDEGDLCEMRDGVLQNLKLSKQELRLLDENFICAFEFSRVGEELFTETLEPLLEKHSPDLLILDPALSYIGGDANEQATVGFFLRNLLNPLLRKYNCGAVVVHHTAKPSAARAAANRVATDYAYLGTGSAEWANWARAVLVLTAKDDNGVRELRIGKRFRLGWKDADGKPSATRLLRQNSTADGIYYTELSAEESMMIGGKLSAFQKVRDSGVLPQPGEEIAKNVLLARIVERGLCGQNKAREVVTLLIDDGFFEPFDKPRSTGPAEKWLRRTDKKFNRLSFVVPGVAPTSHSSPTAPVLGQEAA